MIMRVDEIFTLLQEKYNAVEITTIGSSIIFRKTLMQDFDIDFTFKWSTCLIELRKGSARYFASEYWINEEGFGEKLENTIQEYIETAKCIIQKNKLDKIKEDFT